MTRAWRSEKAQFSGSDTGVTNARSAELNDHQRGPEHSGNLATILTTIGQDASASEAADGIKAINRMLRTERETA